MSQKPYSRRNWLQAVAAGAVAVASAPLLRPSELLASTGLAVPAVPVITVYKTATCGCCTAWIRHMEENGFTARAQDVGDLGAIKRRFGVPDSLASCHTGLVAGYVVEGHVPADLVTRMLNEKPSGLGIAVPGMPIGSPGMEGGTPEKYDVLLFDNRGRSTVYASR